MTKKRTYREPLDPVWAETLLSVPSDRSNNKTVAQMLGGLRAALAKAVEDAREVLSNHPFAEVIASEAARKAGRRGSASLTVDDDGRVYLEITYKTQRTVDSKETVSRAWESNLPSIGELRRTADRIGIDHVPYGRSKVKLQKAIEDHKKAPCKKMMRTGLAVSTATVLNPALYVGPSIKR